MSTLKVAAINNPSASSGGLAISTAGNVTGAGMDLIVAQSFSAASTVNVNNCFSSTYDNYRVMLRLSANSADAGLTMRLRDGVSDSATSVYYTEATGGYNATSSTTNSGALSSWDIAAPKSTLSTYTYAALDVLNPATSTNTLAVGVSTFYDYSSPNRWYITTKSFWHNIAFAYSGLSLLISSGTITGTLRVYGYRN